MYVHAAIYDFYFINFIFRCERFGAPDSKATMYTISFNGI